MKLATRCLPYGALPYENVGAAAKMMAKLFEQMPYLPLMPNIDPDDDLIKRTLLHIPGVSFQEDKVVLHSTSKHYKSELVKLDKAFNSEKLTLLEHYKVESVFLEKYFALVQKFKPKNACLNLIGPFTLSQILKNVAEEQMLVEKSFRKLFIQAICVKALWIAQKIKELSPNTTLVVVLEEPMAGQFGMVKRENEEVTAELVIHLYERIVEKLRKAGIIIAVQCLEKCDWTIAINAGVDMISFDAYNNPNNLCIIPDAVAKFIINGGMINWGIVPTMTESLVKSLNIEYVLNRLKGTMEGLFLAGVSRERVYDSAVVSLQGNIDHLPLIFAEKALILSTQLGSRLPKSK